MKKLILSATLCVMILFSFAQNSLKSFTTDALVTYSKDLSDVSQSDKRIFDKSMIWFYKSFYHTYDKIISSDRNTGIITGRSFFYSEYKVPEKADSARAFDYSNYDIEWTISINNGKINFSVTNMYINPTVDVKGKTLVTTTSKIPYVLLMKTDEKMKNDWSLSKSYLLKNLDHLTTSLGAELATDDDLTWYF